MAATAIPRLQGRTIMGITDGTNTPGASGGSETVAILPTDIPSPTLAAACSSAVGDQGNGSPKDGTTRTSQILHGH